MEMQRFEEAHKIFEHVSQLEPLNTSTSVHKGNENVVFFVEVIEFCFG